MFKQNSIANSIYMFGPILIGFILSPILAYTSFIKPHSFSIFFMGIVLLLTGWTLLAWSKWKQIKLENFTQLGIDSKFSAMKKYYYLGYLFILSGIILSFYSVI